MPLATRFEELIEAVEAGDSGRCRLIADLLKAEYVIVHDGLRNAVARTLAEGIEIAGPKEGEAIGRRVVLDLMGDGEIPQYSQGPIMQRLNNIAAGWHWHATQFELVEEPERFTFILGPCGSGMRLIQEGAYKGGRALPLSVRPTLSTFMSSDYPSYCNHCSEMGHAALRFNKAVFIVEGWTPLREQGICLQHTYKDGHLPPDEFYHRADLPAPDRDRLELKVADPKRWLTDEQLVWIATHPLDRLIQLVESGDREQARELVDECLFGWKEAIHDVYRFWLALLWIEMRDSLGRQVMEDIVRSSGYELLAVLDPRVTPDPGAAWKEYWRCHLRLNDFEVGGGMGVYRNAVEALVDPCLGEAGEDAEALVGLISEGIEGNGRDLGRVFIDSGELVHEVRLAL
ncbi:MAG: hypothetical protein OXC98_01515 [bacterium]|nr:hypothetical protein [Acidimicrobiia bacterium]MCY4649034.1 hypothetical protein [bacterium]